MNIIDKIKSFIDNIKADENEATITLIVKWKEKNVYHILDNVDILEEHYKVKIDIQRYIWEWLPLNNLWDE